jgi:hypothetical protein
MISDTEKEPIDKVLTDIVQGRLILEFEEGSIAVTEEEFPDGFRIREEGTTLGVDIEKHGHKYKYDSHAWDETKMKLVKDTVEGVISEAEITHDFTGLAKKIAEELSELD